MRLVTRVLGQGDLENRGNRPLTWGKDSASEEDFHVLPNRARKDRRKDANGTAKGDRQGEHGHPFSGSEHGVVLPINFDAHCGKWIKSSSEAIRKQGLAQKYIC